MASTPKYAGFTAAFDNELAEANIRWFLSQEDLVEPQSIGSSAHATAPFCETRFRTLYQQGTQHNSSHFLGTYVEAIWRYYLQSSVRYRVIAHNLQIHDERKTIGEFDFLIEDQDKARFIHQEIATKFYLGLPMPDREQCLWFGPNQIDRLDKKVAHLQHKQLVLSQTAAAKAVLNNIGVSQVTSECILRGRLFMPYNSALADQCSRYETDTQHVAKDRWFTFSELESYWSHPTQLKREPSFWLLEKPQWMSLTTLPERSLTRLDALAELRRRVVDEGRAVMLKVQANSDADQNAAPKDYAVFVVRDNWSEACYASISAESA